MLIVAVPSSKLVESHGSSPSLGVVVVVIVVDSEVGDEVIAEVSRPISVSDPVVELEMEG